MRSTFVLVAMCLGGAANADPVASCDVAGPAIAQLYRFDLPAAELAQLARTSDAITRRCASERWPFDVRACATSAAGDDAIRACVARLPEATREALDADGVALFPYSVEIGKTELVPRGPIAFVGDKLREKSPLLDTVAATLRVHPTLRIEIRAFGDPKSGRHRQAATSRARAEAVRAYLIAAKIAGDRLTAKGHGAGRIEPHRIQFAIVAGAPDTVVKSVPNPANPADAKAHFESGERAYNAGDYARAAAEFERAYAEAPHPALLFNIGQAYKQQGDKAAAISYFERYMHDAPAKAPHVRQLIDELRK